MSKKVFMLATPTCGYCRQAKAMIEQKYPDLDETKFEYFVFRGQPLEGDAAKVMSFARGSGVKGVPFTVLMDEEGFIVNAVRGYSRDNIFALIDETLDGGITGIDSEQLN